MTYANTAAGRASRTGPRAAWGGNAAGDPDWITVASLPKQMVRLPHTETEWLMMPFETTPMLDESHREAVVDAIDQLSERSRECIEAYFFEQVPYSELGVRLGCSKPHAFRLTRKAIEELRALLAPNPAIYERYHLTNPTWNKVLAEQINFFADGPRRPAPLLPAYKEKADLLSFSVRQMQEPSPVIFENLGRMAVATLVSLNEWSVLDMYDLMIQRQQDYGHGNINSFGIVGVCVRLCDKIARIVNIVGKGGVANEPLVDAYRDIVGYCIIARLLIAGTFDLELEAA